MTMKKLRLYLDTTIFNYAFADDCPIERDITLKFFFQIDRFEVCISDIVLREISRCSEIKQKKLFELVHQYDLEVLGFDDNADELSVAYVRNGIIPVKYEDDANHIAIASVRNCDVILSWNFKHIVKVKTKREVAGINLLKGYNLIDIYTPKEVIEDV